MNETARVVVDLSHVVRDGTTTYPGLPGPRITDHLSRAESAGRFAPGTQFQIGRIDMVANTGTYVDAPFHRYPDGHDLARVPLSRLVDLPGLVVRAGGGRAVGVEVFESHGDRIEGRAVLVHTGWDARWGTPGYGDASHPYLTADAARWLRDRRPALVGIDSVNIDDMGDPSRPVHTGLLAADVPIVEHLTGLDQLPEDGFRFHAAPVAVEGMGSFPVRAYAILAR